MNGEQIAQPIGGQNWQESRRGLDRIKELLFRLGNPQKKLKFIHVAGTNGKGSTSAMLESMYRAAGYKTGLYTSPHLESYTERIKVGGENIPAKIFTTLLEIIRRQSATMKEEPTEFEVLTAMGFAYFYMTKCDIVILEVGLGGRLDATNVIAAPEATVFTPIGLDHTAQLGGTVESIAKEKAAIIKKGSQVISSIQLPAVQKVLEDSAKTANANFLSLPLQEIHLRETDDDGQVFDFGRFHDIRIPLLGGYQIYNASTAIATVRLLREKGWDVDKKAMYKGLAEVKWPGRFEILHKSPMFILDGAHNLPGVETLLDTAKTYWPNKKVAILMGVLIDKDYESIIKALIPNIWKVVAITPKSDRALPADQLVEIFKQNDFPNAVSAESVEEGINLLLQEADSDDVLIALGSLYFSSEVQKCFPLIPMEQVENDFLLKDEQNFVFNTNQMDGE